MSDAKIQNWKYVLTCDKCVFEPIVTLDELGGAVPLLFQGTRNDATLLWNELLNQYADNAYNRVSQPEKFIVNNVVMDVEKDELDWDCRVAKTLDEYLDFAYPSNNPHKISNSSIPRCNHDR